MYLDLLGFPKDRTEEKEFTSPFPKKNKLTLVVPETTTKFTQRDEKQFNEINNQPRQLGNVHAGFNAHVDPAIFGQKIRMAEKGNDQQPQQQAAEHP